MVLLPAFNKSAKLPEGETVPVEFLPKEPGEYEFACQMGMFRGHRRITAPRPQISLTEGEGPG